MSEVTHSTEIEIEPGIDIFIAEWQAKAAIDTIVDQWLRDHGPIDPAVVRRALTLWIHETAERMLSDVDWWTGPYSPVDHRFFELLRKQPAPRAARCPCGEVGLLNEAGECPRCEALHEAGADWQEGEGSNPHTWR